MTMFWMLAMGVVGIFCIAQAVRDFRAGNRLWAAAALICAALVLLTPIRANLVSADVPASLTQE